MDVRDAAGHIFKFGTLRLGAGEQPIIHTRKGTSHTCPVRNSMRVGNVCGTTVDKVILRRADGSLKGRLLGSIPSRRTQRTCSPHPIRPTAETTRSVENQSNTMQTLPDAP